ncbi:hypothetical protein [Acidovorax sp.]|uniref:hypothetical protein n=1 Tax=Acidovorax sp. TaxID=1872122 RepID=UPI003CFFC80B
MISYNFEFPAQGVPSHSILATDNEEMTGLFLDVEAFLVRQFDYSESAAASLVREYKLRCRLWSNKQRDGSMFHDDEYLLHEGASSVAILLYYMVVVKGPADRSSFLQWRKEFFSG